MLGSSLVQWGYWPIGQHHDLPSHKNPGLELVYIRRGHVQWQVEGRIESVPPGSVFFTFPWETHGSVTDQSIGCELFYAVVRLKRTTGRRLRFDHRLGLANVAQKTLSHQALRSTRRCFRATQRLSVLLPELIVEAKRAKPDQSAIDALVRLLLIELTRSISRDPPPSQEPAAAERAVKELVARLPTQCHQPWSLAAMAAACRLGRTRFADLLKQLTGDTPMMVVGRARIERAKRLLRHTDRPITQIALDCGFASSQHFAHNFRAYTGITATTYRASNAASA